MVVFALTNARPKTRGLLSRYCLEVRAGLFVGRMDKRMRLKLWAEVKEAAKPTTAGVMMWATRSAQGYGFDAFGPGARQPVLYDGLWLIAQEKNARAKKDGGAPKHSPERGGE